MRHAGGNGIAANELGLSADLHTDCGCALLVQADPLLVFAMAALTIVPLSKIVGSSTETLGAYLGPTLGGLLNASMGNAPELIIGVFALKNGLITVVKASLTGSIVGNLLLTLGLAMFAGGLRYPSQKFNVKSARLSMSMMFLAVAGLMVPALFHFTSRNAEHEISIEIAAVLLLVYVLSMVYTLFTHRKMFKVSEPAELEVAKTHSWKIALGLLAAATLVLALISEILTDAPSRQRSNCGSMTCSRASSCWPRSATSPA